ncbi:MAG: response regulator [Dokdonella sp.]
MNESSERFDLLRQRYAGLLSEKQRVMTQAWAAFAAMPSDAGARGELQQQLHRLCGSAQAYGYADLGKHACSADSLLRRWEGLLPALRDAPTDLAERLNAPIQAMLAGFDETRIGAAEHASDPPPGALRVLLIEDDLVQAVMIGAKLEAHGCKVRCESGTDLLWQTLILWPCHAIVIDYWLRGETATEVVANLRREPRFARLALVCYSVESDPQVLRAVTEAGCDALVAKSEGSARLFGVIRACVARADRSGPDMRPAAR